MKKQIKTDNSAAPVADYSQAISIGKTLYVSGQIGINPETGLLVNESFEIELKQVFSNIQSILESAEYSIKDVVKVEVFLTNVNQFDVFNLLYKNFVETSEIKPVRQTVIVKELPKKASVEISVIAQKD